MAEWAAVSGRPGSVATGRGVRVARKHLVGFIEDFCKPHTAAQWRGHICRLQHPQAVIDAMQDMFLRGHETGIAA